MHKFLIVLIWSFFVMAAAVSSLVIFLTTIPVVGLIWLVYSLARLTSTLSVKLYAASEKRRAQRLQRNYSNDPLWLRQARETMVAATARSTPPPRC